MLVWQHYFIEEDNQEFCADFEDIHYSTYKHHEDGVWCEASLNSYVFWRVQADSLEDGKLRCQEFCDMLPKVIQVGIVDTKEPDFQ